MQSPISQPVIWQLLQQKMRSPLPGTIAKNWSFIIVAHNFGDIYPGTYRSEMVPAIANRVKLGLGIKNTNVLTHDVCAGCPGWTTAMIVANAYIKSGTFKSGLVIGSDLNSRASDPYDRDRMIFSDGSGAVIVEAVESETPIGILAQASRSGQ